MSYSITFSFKILTLEITPFLFIFVGIPCEFAMVSDVYILLSPQEEKVSTSSWGERHTHLAVHSSKRFKPLPTIILLCEGNTSKKHDFKIITFVTGSLSIDFW